MSASHQMPAGFPPLPSASPTGGPSRALANSRGGVSASPRAFSHSQIGPSANTRVQPAVPQRGKATAAETDSAQSFSPIRPAGVDAPAGGFERGRPGRPPTEWTPRMDAMLRAQYGKAKAQILADDIGVALATLYRRLKELGIPRAGHRHAVSDEVAARIIEERNSGATIRATARLLGVTRKTVERKTRGKP